MTKPSIAVLTSYWSTNIGNSFFQLGAGWVLRQALPEANVFPIGDQPGYWHPKHGNPAHALDYVKHLEIDALVVQGPFFRPEMTRILTEALDVQLAKGTKLIVLAAGMMSYDSETVKLARETMQRVRPWIFTTRDTETYEAVGDLAEHAYDGVDVATFVSDLYEPVPTDLPPYVAWNFDQIPEPRFVKTEAGSGGRVIEYDGDHWRIEQPGWRTEMSYKSRAYPYLDGLMLKLLGKGRGPEKMGDRLIVRTDHRYNPYFEPKTYRGQNTYSGDVPYTYLNIYANADCVFSNRVHACVAAASFGRPAMLFTRSPRAYLLKRLGLEGIKDGPVTLDLANLRDEKDRMTRWLSERLADYRAPATAQVG